MILLLGATGHIGQAFAAEMRRRDLSFVPLSRQTLDYTRLDVLFQYLRAEKPSFVINAAGYTGRPNIDQCEIARAETVRANTLLPQTVARACYLMKIPWGHVSSGDIYSGAKVVRQKKTQIERDLNQPEVRGLFQEHPECFKGFVEEDEPNFSFRAPPCSFYSGAKALAEEALAWNPQGYLWRPHFVFDETDHPRNFLSRLQRYPKVHDSVNSLSHRSDFVRACLDLWERHAPFGTYNVVNPGALSGREIVETIRRILQPRRSFEFWANDEEFYRDAVRAPRANCILDVSKLLATGIELRPVREALEDSLRRWQGAPPDLEWTNELLKSNTPR